MKLQLSPFAEISPLPLKRLAEPAEAMIDEVAILTSAEVNEAKAIKQTINEAKFFILRPLSRPKRHDFQVTVQQQALSMVVRPIHSL